MDLLVEPANVYHGIKAKENLGSHMLGSFRDCPLLYQKKKQGLIRDKDTKYYAEGRAAHTRILESVAKFNSLYVAGGPINESTGKVYGSGTKKFSEWADQQGGREPLTDSQFELIFNVNRGVKANLNAVQLLSEGQAEGVVRTGYRGLPCQIRLDWFHESVGIVDLKTCADLTWFEADAKRYGYDNQLAFYQTIMFVATGHLYPVHIIAVEKQEPYRCGVWDLSEKTLLQATFQNDIAIGKLLKCMEDDVWPTRYEAIRTLEI